MNQEAHQSRLMAAQGYVELGMAQEAIAELASLQSFPFSDPDLLELRLHLLIELRQWSEATLASQELLDLSKEKLSAYIHGAFALHELGRTSDARDLLLLGASRLSQDPNFHYNLGCYEAVLGNRDSALQSIEQSFLLDSSLRDFAQHDPDLAQLSGKF